MKIEDFTADCLEQAVALARENYAEERRAVAVLPSADHFPELTCFADNHLGAAAFENDVMIGFLCCYEPHENAFDSNASGVFSPMHAHAAQWDGREEIYRRLYQSIAQKWVKAGALYHSIALYAHDGKAKEALFTDGFGMRCVDAIRAMESIAEERPLVYACRQLALGEEWLVRELRRGLCRHLAQSPCFMDGSPAQFERWIVRAEHRDTALFAAFDRTRPIAFLEVSSGGENFASNAADMRNICGAYCLPEYRGRGAFQHLLNYAIAELKAQGFARLGVDYESINPTALAFWPKYFTPYTNSVVRRISECATFDCI